MKRSGFIQLAARMLYTALRHFCCAESEASIIEAHHGQRRFLEISTCNVNSRGRDTGNFSGTEKSFRSSIEKKKLSRSSKKLCLARSKEASLTLFTKIKTQAETQLQESKERTTTDVAKD